MHVPTADELAAIAAVYVAVTSRAETPAQPEAPRWRLAGRLPEIDEQRVRFAAASASRWNAAGRLDG
ncbi:MAG TPA: hypothetical protein VGT98_18045 [Candidatus Elarobacter sp.]|nr:hypothetical protein [Candidatus Elarobacter sp.]HEV2739777.1 hypothetical protein [Candidatus Elarobacter sp.]